MNEKDQYESLACNCVEVGTIIKEDDTLLTLDLNGANAETQLEQLKADALKIGSGNCKVSAETIDEGGKTVVRAMLDFDCAAEKLIFQMKHS